MHAIAPRAANHATRSTAAWGPPIDHVSATIPTPRDVPSNHRGRQSFSGSTAPWCEGNVSGTGSSSGLVGITGCGTRGDSAGVVAAGLGAGGSSVGQNVGVTEGGVSPLPDGELARVLEGLPDGVVVIDQAATVLWMNTRFLHLTGWTREELVGRNGLEMLDPEQLADAVEALAIAVDSPYVLPPGSYRLAHRDGGFVSLELHAAPVDPSDPASPIAMLARPIEYRVVMTEGIEVLNAGGPIDDMARYIVDRIGWVGGAISIAYDDDLTGERRAVSSGLPSALDGSQPAADGVAPWDEVLTTGQPVERPLDELPPTLRDAAKQHGFVSCTADAVVDPGGRAAVIVLWFDFEAPPSYRFLFREEPRYLLLRLALERRHYHRALQLAASQDHLTGLANRVTFFDALEREPKERRAAALYIDLDDFKPINDTYGHLAGDAVLEEMGRRLRAAVRPTDLVARLGGDEFAVLCRDVSTEASAEILAQRIHESVTVPVPLADDGRTGRVGASIGVAIAAEAGTDPMVLLDQADRLLRELKRQGKDGWRSAVVSPRS